MDCYVNVRPEHLNFHGYLFGGHILKWVDEFAWLAASRDYPGCTLVTMALNDIVFKQRTVCGSILRFSILPERQGATSLTYRVTVLADEPGAEQEKEVFDTRITFVRLDENGAKKALPPRPERLRSEMSGEGPMPIANPFR